MEELISLICHPETAVCNRAPPPGGWGHRFWLLVIYLVCLRTIDKVILKNNNNKDEPLIWFFGGEKKASL